MRKYLEWLRGKFKNILIALVNYIIHNHSQCDHADVCILLFLTKNKTNYRYLSSIYIALFVLLKAEIITQLLILDLIVKVWINPSETFVHTDKFISQ